MQGLISRQAALKKLAAYIHLIDKTMGKGTLTDDDCMEAAKSVLGEDELPAAQPERDIPIKPVEATDTAWGIPNRQAVCPKCDCYLGHVAFLGDYKGKKVTYCETCGQAIDWEGWGFE